MGNTYRQKWILGAEDRTKMALASVKKNLGGVDKVMGLMSGNIAAMLGAGAGLGATIAMLNSTAESFDTLAKRSHALGMAADELDAWDYAAQLNGASSSDLEAALRRLPQAMYDAANGSKMTADAFAALGVQVTDDKGNLRDITSVLLDVSEGMSKMESATERNAVASKVMGRNGGAMVNMLKNGKTALTENLVEAHALGTRYDALVLKGEEYEDSQLRINRALRGTKDAVVGYALPSLSALADTISNDVVTMITGLDADYREFLGNLRVMPAETALDMIADKEAELRGEIDASRKVMEQATSDLDGLNIKRGIGLRAVGEATGQQREYLDVLSEEGDRTAELQKQLKALSAEKGRAQQKLDLMTEAQKRWEDSEKAAAEAADKAREADRRRAATLVEELTPAEQHIVDLLDQREAAQKRQNDLMDEGAQLTEDLLTPTEKYLNKLDWYYELADAGAISQETLNRALGRAEESLRNAERAAAGYGNEARDAFGIVEAAGTGAAGVVGDALTSMVQIGKGELKSLSDYAIDVSNQIYDAMIQAGLINPFTNWLGNLGQSAPASTTAPAANPISVPDYQMVSAGGGSVATMPAAATVPVSITINALDTKDAVEVIAKHEPMIIGMVQKAYNQRGQRGPLG